MLITMAVGMLLLFALVFLAARTVLLDGYAQLEKDKTHIQMNSVSSLLKEQTQQLDGVINQYGHWDDTYAYIINHNAEYIRSNYTNDIFKDLDVKAILLIDNDGNVVYKRGFDAATQKPWPIPDNILKATSTGGILFDPSKPVISGLFWTPLGACIVSAADILPSSNTGKRRGRMIVVRHLDPVAMHDMEQILDAKISINPIDTIQSDSIKQLLSSNKTVSIPLNEAQVAGYSQLNDIGTNTDLVLRTVSDRKIYQQGKSSLKFLYWSLTMLALALAAFSWLFDQLVLSRIARLNKDVKKIGESANKVGRVESLKGDDELASLAAGINSMLSRLDASQLDLQFEKERAQVTLAGIADAVITSNNKGCVLYMNAAAEQLTGIKTEDAVGKTLQSLFKLKTEDKSKKVDSAWLIDANSTIDEVVLVGNQGQDYVITKSASFLSDQNGVAFGTVTVLHDVTMLRVLSNQLYYQARHDSLTGLINRYEFDRKTQAAIDDAASYNRVHCLAYFDLDQFKVVNDTCGHQAGDQLLRQLSDHLKSRVCSSDTLARLGGDEFALLLIGCSLDKAKEIIDNLLQVVREYRFSFDKKVFKVGASVGLTQILPNNTLTLSELLSLVDSACYTAKEQGGNRYHVFQPNDSGMKEHNSQLQWVSRIHLGLEKKQFLLYVQRLQSLIANAEPHCELLIRMRGDDGTLYSPGSFLPAAERYHLMPQIDRWVVSQALRIIAAKGADFNSMCAINLSGQSLSEEGFLEYVIGQIKLHKINTQRICFEITETAVIANLEKARQFMHALRDIGCRFSLDGFGSGLSSFAYLKNLKVDFLKIDGIFVKNIVNNPIDRAMVESIHNVGHVMGLHTVAEFAENSEIIEVLKQIGVDYAQGYGVAMPELFE